MYPIYTYGSEDQKRRYLPKMASGEIIGCFGLTEHDGGSDPGAMKTTARSDGDFYVLNGVKMWISNGGIADVALIWAKDDAGVVRGFLVPTDTPGFTANEIKHKMSLRASVTSELVLEDARIPQGLHAPRREGTRRAPLLPHPGPLRHRLGRPRRAGVGLHRGPGLRQEPLHLRQAHRGAPTGPRQARRHAHRPHRGPHARLAPGKDEG